MSWNSVGRVQRSANYANKHDRGRTYEKTKSQVVGKKEDKEWQGDVNEQILQVAMRIIIIGQLPLGRR